MDIKKSLQIMKNHYIWQHCTVTNSSPIPLPSSLTHSVSAFHLLPFSSIPVQGTFPSTTYSQTPSQSSLDMVSCLANANDILQSSGNGSLEEMHTFVVLWCSISLTHLCLYKKDRPVCGSIRYFTSEMLTWVLF